MATPISSTTPSITWLWAPNSISQDSLMHSLHMCTPLTKPPKPRSTPRPAFTHTFSFLASIQILLPNSKPNPTQLSILAINSTNNTTTKHLRSTYYACVKRKARHWIPVLSNYSCKPAGGCYPQSTEIGRWRITEVKHDAQSFRAGERQRREVDPICLAA